MSSANQSSSLAALAQSDAFVGAGAALKAECRDATLRQSVALLGAVYACSLAALLMVGASPAVPWSFLPYCGLCVIPLAYAVACGLFQIETRLAIQRWALPPAAVLLGLAVIAAHQLSLAYWQVTAAVFLFFISHLPRSRRVWLRPLLMSGAALFFLYGAVWNLNHLVGLSALHRLHDSQVMGWDLTAYGYLFGTPVEAAGLFPLVRSRLLFLLMENAYLLIFCEIFVVVFVRIWRRAALTPFLAVVLAAYVLAAAIFFAFPVVGPFIYPETIDPAYHDTRTFQIMTLLNESYEQIRLRELNNGFGYVVGLPSLHVAMAIIMARFLIVSRVHFWAFLPINILMAAATCFQGYHYLVDAAAGALLGVGLLIAEAIWLKKRPATSEPASQAADTAVDPQPQDKVSRGWRPSAETSQ